MITAQTFINRINDAEQGEWQPHAIQFADWLTERGDPFGEHLRELVRRGKEPLINPLNMKTDTRQLFEWFLDCACGDSRCWLPKNIDNYADFHREDDTSAAYRTRFEALADYIRVVQPAMVCLTCDGAGKLTTSANPSGYTITPCPDCRK